MCATSQEKTTKRGENSDRGMIIVCNVPGKDDTTKTAQSVVRLPNMKLLLDVLFVFQNRRENSDRDRVIVCNVPGEGDTTTTAQFAVQLLNLKLFLDV